MSLHEFSYQHWEGRHCGIWRRRWVIAINGLKSCLDNRWARNLVLAAWTIALAAVGILFLIGQLLVPDSDAYKMVENLNQQMRDLFEGLKAWLTDRPEISVRVAYNMLFYFFASTLYWLGHDFDDVGHSSLNQPGLVQPGNHHLLFKGPQPL